MRYFVVINEHLGATQGSMDVVNEELKVIRTFPYPYNDEDKKMKAFFDADKYANELTKKENKK